MDHLNYLGWLKSFLSLVFQIVKTQMDTGHRMDRLVKIWQVSEGQLFMTKKERQKMGTSHALRVGIVLGGIDTQPMRLHHDSGAESTHSQLVASVPLWDSSTLFFSRMAGPGFPSGVPAITAWHP